MDDDIDVLATDYPRGHAIGLHAHDAAQLVFARSGVMRVTTADGVRVVPPARALYMPARMPHSIHCTTALAMRSVYMVRGAGRDLSAECAVLNVTPLMREIVIRLVEGPASPRQRRLLAALLMEEMTAVHHVPLHLPEPESDALRRIGEALRADPADRRVLEDWARETGMSRRTLARRFLAETGMGFSAWRRQLRFLRAVERLGEGAPVTEVAFDAGYDSPSAFISAFRRTLGVTPRRYFAEPTAES